MLIEVKNLLPLFFAELCLPQKGKGYEGGNRKAMEGCGEKRRGGILEMYSHPEVSVGYSIHYYKFRAIFPLTNSALGCVFWMYATG